MSITINDTPYPFDGEDIECFYDAIDAVIRKAEWTEKQFMGFATVPSIKKDNKTINNSNVSMRLFGSTGEPDGRGDGIWDGGLVVSL